MKQCVNGKDKHVVQFETVDSLEPVAHLSGKVMVEKVAKFIQWVFLTNFEKANGYLYRNITISTLILNKTFIWYKLET